MTSIHVFDPALCCSSGVCGVEVDQQLVDFASDMNWLKEQAEQGKQDVRIARFNLAQQPLAFAENPTVRAFLERSGQEGLPLILVNGEIALTGRYPRRSELARWAGVAQPVAEAKPAGGCCSGSGCC